MEPKEKRGKRPACDVGCQTEPPSSKLSSKSPTNWSGVACGSYVSSKNSPAGVKPHVVADYFAEKLAAPVTNTKLRTSSTTGVVGEGKKCVRTSTQAGSSKADGPSWADENCKLRLVINCFSHLNETVCSEAKLIQGVQWKIMVMPKQHLVQKKHQKCMGFFLQCSPEKAYSDQWNVHAIADMRMLSYKANVPHFARRTTHTYTAKENDWGYSCFMTWADILDESQGYIKDDTVILEIAVKADAPKNMMTHEEFVERIDKWLLLAEMQRKKGNIDLAIEANANALKFCKDKDMKCRAKLIEQNEQFVKEKLFESIERIEKGVPVVSNDANNGKPTSLRQALTGAQISLSGKMTAKGGKKTKALVSVQHVKKKKPYEQKVQKVTEEVTIVVKDTAENLDDMLKDKKDEISESSSICDGNEFESNNRTFETDSEANYDDEDDVYNETNFVEKALIVNKEERQLENAGKSGGEEDEDDDDDDDDDEDEAEWHSSCDDIINLAQNLSMESCLPVFKGKNDDGVLICDRQTQTNILVDDFDDFVSIDTDVGDEYMAKEDAMMYANKCEPPSKKVRDEDEDDDVDDVDDEEGNDNACRFFVNNSIENGKPKYNISKWVEVAAHERSPMSFDEIKGTLEFVDRFSNVNLEVLRQKFADSEEAAGDGKKMFAVSDQVIRRLLNFQGEMKRNLKPESVLGRMSAEDRTALLEEINEKVYPIVLFVDMEFRRSAYDAQQFLKGCQTLFDYSRKIMKDSEAMLNKLNERFTPYFLGVLYKDDVGNGEREDSSTSSSAAASPIRKSERIIAQSKKSRNVAKKTDGDVQDTDDALSFANINTQLEMEIANMNVAYNRVHKMISGDMFVNRLSDVIDRREKHLTSLIDAAQKMEKKMDELMGKKAQITSQLGETKQLLKSEQETNAKLAKEVKELKSAVKKSENRALKEEKNVHSIQAQMNQLEDKFKALKKEHESLKKKTGEERNRFKKEKERLETMIKMQSEEGKERDAERDMLKRELDESREAERERLTQLNEAMERARKGECEILESRKMVAVEIAKRRKQEAVDGCGETEQNLSKVRQATDRDVIGKSWNEWKQVVEKCEAMVKQTISDYDTAIEAVRSGAKSLAQIGEIRRREVELPKLVKPPPVQVVAPSTIPQPSVGVIGQQLAKPREEVAPVQSSSSSSSLWSWNTIGNLSELRQSQAEASFANTLDALQRDIWANNGNGRDFARAPGYGRAQPQHVPPPAVAQPRGMMWNEAFMGYGSWRNPQQQQQQQQQQQHQQQHHQHFYE